MHLCYVPPQAQFQGGAQSSGLFVTAAAQNLLCLKLAAELGVIVPDAWMTWFKGAIVPAVIGTIAIPWVLYYLLPPEVGHTAQAVGCRQSAAQLSTCRG
jgi:di/tricarboxylate transporter